MFTLASLMAEPSFAASGVKKVLTENQRQEDVTAGGNAVGG